MSEWGGGGERESKEVDLWQSSWLYANFVLSSSLKSKTEQRKRRKKNEKKNKKNFLVCELLSKYLNGSGLIA